MFNWTKEVEFTEYQILETKPVWVAYVNSDTTEGRGYNYPLYVCDSYETAVRLGKGRNVVGSDAEVREEMAIKHDGKWYIPGLIMAESDKDKALRIKREAKESALEKARQYLSEEEIEALKGS